MKRQLNYYDINDVLTVIPNIYFFRTGQEASKVQLGDKSASDLSLHKSKGDCVIGLLMCKYILTKQSSSLARMALISSCDFVLTNFTNKAVFQLANKIMYSAHLFLFDYI